MYDPRHYQTKAVSAGVAALRKFLNTLIIAPTGSGKTAILSFIAGLIGGRVLVLQHTGHLIEQNSQTFMDALGVPASEIGIVQGPQREWDAPRAVFGSIQTVQQNLDDMRHYDLIVIDEGHRAAAPGYVATINRAREINPNIMLLVITATPERGDGKPLSAAGITNCAHIIEIHEMIAEGILVPPKAARISVGVDEIVKDRPRSFSPMGDDPEVAAIMNQNVTVDAIVKDWLANCERRKTLAFSPSTASADLYAEAFRGAGIDSFSLHSKVAKEKQKDILAEYKSKSCDTVVFNCLMLTEGFDDQPTSCILNQRNVGSKGLLTQMLGRGLRRVDPLRFPGLIKTDCLVRDYGASLVRHPDLFEAPKLDVVKGNGKAPTKNCPKCKFIVPLNARECPNCGEDFPVRVKGKNQIFEVKMIDIDLLAKKSKWRWMELGPSTRAAQSFEGLVVARRRDDGTWKGFMSPARGRPTEVLIGSLDEVCTVLDDALTKISRLTSTSRKSASWHREPPSPAQMKVYRDNDITIPQRQLTKYEASLTIGTHFLLDEIRRGRLSL
jgi:superfamily II DNA or RNA helicase